MCVQEQEHERNDYQDGLYMKLKSQTQKIKQTDTFEKGEL